MHTMNVAMSGYAVVVVHGSITSRFGMRGKILSSGISI